MRPVRFVQMLLLASGLLTAALAADSEPLSRQLKWRTFPDPKAVSAASVESRLYPDWQPEVLSSAEYDEVIDRQGRHHVCITGTSRELVYATVIHFAAGGQSRLAVAGIALRPGQIVTLTFVPAENDHAALTQLALWRAAPAESALTQLMLTGTAGAAPLGGLCYVQWFKRETASRRNPPWQDIFLPLSTPPAGFVREDWPLCLAEITHKQDLLTKDCAVQFKGLTSFGLDQEGPYGFWQLSWSTPLTVKLDIASPSIPPKSMLLVYAQAESIYPWGTEPALEVTANNYRLPQVAQPVNQLIMTQPISIELSQYLQQGINTIDVGASALGAATWKVRRIELWAE